MNQETVNDFAWWTVVDANGRSIGYGKTTSRYDAGEYVRMCNEAKPAAHTPPSPFRVVEA